MAFQYEFFNVLQRSYYRPKVQMAEKFGVAPSRITRIKQEDAWGWLREEYPQLYKELDDFKLGETQ